MHWGSVTAGRALRHSILQVTRCVSSKIYTGYTSQQNLLGWQQRQQLKKEKETAADASSHLSSGSLVADMLIKEKVFEVGELRKDEEKVNHVTEVARMLKSKDKIHTIFREYEESIRSIAKQTANEKPIETDLLCPGCGAELHSIEPTQAGYVNYVRFAEFFSEPRTDRLSDFTKKRGRRKRKPSEAEGNKVKTEKDSMNNNAERDELTIDNQKVLRDAPHCDRCTVLQKYKLALNVAVPESAYATIMRHIRANKQPACVLVVVDVTDLPFSIPTNLVDAFDSELHRFIVVVTKCDRVGLPISAIDPSQFGNSEQLGLVRMDNKQQNESECEGSLSSTSQGSIVESESGSVIKSILRDQMDSTHNSNNRNVARGVTPVETRRTVLLRWTREVLRSVEARARITRSQVDAVAFVSARTGFGIDELVSSILQQQRKRNIYLVGAANAGKSSLFNTLAASDLCNANVRAAQLVQRATVSTFPGTTIGLLRFPITQLTPKRTAVRDERLNVARSAWVRQWTLSRNRVALAAHSDSTREMDTDVEVEADDNKLKHSDRYRLSAPVVQSLDAAVILDTDEYQVADELATYSTDSGSKAKADDPDGDNAVCIFETQKSEQTVKDEHTRLRFGVRPEQFAHARWCLDTPGIVQRDHVANALNQQELERLLSGDVWLPRTFRLRPALTMFLSGLVRIDFLDPGDPIYVTVFSSCRVLICQTELAEPFYYDHLEKLMQLPKRTRAPEERRADLFVDPTSASYLSSSRSQTSHEGTTNATYQLNTTSPAEMNAVNTLNDQQKLLFSSFPSLVAHHVALRGVGYRESCADFALSHVGWCAVTAKRDQIVNFRVFTLGGHGFSVRAPLLPFAVNERGPKIRGTVEYKVRR